MTGHSDILAEIDRLLEADIELQRRKVFQIARSLVPTITEDDVAQPHDFEELRASEQFNFEDGYLSGLMGAQIAIRARIASRYR